MIVGKVYFKTPYSSVLENETHLVLVLTLREHLGSVWDGSNLDADLFVSILKFTFDSIDCLFDFRFHLGELGVLLLNLQNVFQLIDFWHLCNNFNSLFLDTLNH